MTLFCGLRPRANVRCMANTHTFLGHILHEGSLNSRRHEIKADPAKEGECRQTSGYCGDSKGPRDPKSQK
jgi:hypothetical protein